MPPLGLDAAARGAAVSTGPSRRDLRARRRAKRGRGACQRSDDRVARSGGAVGRPAGEQPHRAPCTDARGARMLKGVDPLLGPNLLAILRGMGHGDEIVLADANFPASDLARRLERADGIDAVRMLRALASVLPLD